MACGVKWQQVNELTNAITFLERAGLGAEADAIRQLTGLRSKLLGQVGLKFPRTITSLIKLIGLSPGTITLWHDVEAGFMTSARADPNSPTVWKYVSGDTAVKLLKRELTHELEESLWTPDPYIGE